MYFGELLKKARESAELSINKLSMLTDISPTYISRIEKQKDKLPSNEIAFTLISWLSGMQKDNSELKKVAGKEIDDMFLASLIQTKYHKEIKKKEMSQEEIELKFEKISYDYYDFLKRFNDSLRNERNEALEKVYKNHFLTNSKEGSLVIDQENINERIKNLPILDLKWLLTQKKFEVFFGRDYLFENNKKEFYYNTISDEDKKIIFSIITAYFNEKYEKINKPKEFFFNKFKYIKDFFK
ncbi:helix-turn-helix domain-containing protein [Staphylococcus aureus]|uniref:helix-turn-helix domain-containing protein n=1 Tax=Staphylococcus aureus TaxID=1280 RepID=UPI000DFCCE75|nr:helix-turn-helix transcriptional regulator [Staphylococcus aureus]SUK21645.1 SaPI1 [Staphylococcus aureus]SUK95903.1 SaPI1 [Staphylococcus aureus]SUL09612.1 SaPI1 [Staphylococcus aureus]SUL10182.1 SaPI1 [Staphylococcus aureus]SUL83318.1 SaPI1 [Staphylococcus aureus]